MNTFSNDLNVTNRLQMAIQLVIHLASMKYNNTDSIRDLNLCLLLIAGLTLCSGIIGCKPTLVPEGAILENIHGPIREIYGPSADGTVSLTIGSHARWFAIHPDFSPDSRVLEEFARQAVNTQKIIDATVWARDPELTKANPQGNNIPGPPWVIIRLLENKDGPSIP